ncbi:MAG: Clp protease N-terminal domain-containing protein [Solirubrobacteraceae bacterium]
MFERFTERARQVVVLAQEEARSVLKHNYIGTEHILLGLIREEQGVAAQVLESSGITLEGVREQVARIVGSGEEVNSGQIPFTPRAKKVLELALREALELSHNYIGTEHILLGLLRVNESVGFRVLVDCDADPAKLRKELIVLAGSGDREIRGQTTSSEPGPDIDPGWLGDLPGLLKPLGAWIRTDLGRPPDVGDLLLAIVCVPDTPAAGAVHELGIDVDQLRDRIELARARDRAGSQALAQRMAEVTLAKELAIEQQRFDEAAALRDQERELRDQERAHQRARMDAVSELCRRLSIPRSPDDP